MIQDGDFGKVDQSEPILKILRNVASITLIETQTTSTLTKCIMFASVVAYETLSEFESE